jgi:hypothetical protein
MPTSHDLTTGARFEIQANDPARLGNLIWIGCTVVDGVAHETETRGVDVWSVRRDDGRVVFATLAQLRAVAS